MKTIDKKQLSQEQFDEIAQSVQMTYLELKDRYDAEQAKINAKNAALAQ